MPCEIADVYGYRKPDGTLVGIPDALIYAVPSDPLAAVDYGGDWHTLNGLNPNVFGGPSTRYAVLIRTGLSGDWTVTLPYAATETDPGAPPMQWSLLFPDGSILAGAVPSETGPLDLKALRTLHGWRWLSQVYVTPVTPGTFAKGTAAFAGGATVATIVFLTPFASSAYQISLAASADTVDGTIPRVGWANKTATGFEIHTDTAGYAGLVDWGAQL